jgi:putative transcriptional regulator
MHSSSDRGPFERDEAVPAAEQTDWARIEAMTEEEAYQNALADEDNPPLTNEQLARLRRVPNPQEIRERLGLTQREFARQFQIALGTLRDWEQGASRPDSAAKAYLRVIDRNPVAVRSALSTEASRPAITDLPGFILTGTFTERAAASLVMDQRQPRSHQRRPTNAGAQSKSVDRIVEALSRTG